MKRLLLAAVAAAAVAASPTNTTVTVNGQTYHRVQWGPVETVVPIQHARGKTFLRVADLPADVQAQLQATGRVTASIPPGDCLKLPVQRVKVLQVLRGEGLLVRTVTELGADTLFLSPAWDVVDGQWLEFKGKRIGTYRYTNTLGATSTVEHWEACQVTELR